MFIASECYKGVEDSTDLCVLDTEDCTVERISINDIKKFLDSGTLKIRNTIKNPVSNLWEVYDNRVIRGNIIKVKDDFVTCNYTSWDGKYYLKIGNRSPIELDFSTTGLKVNKRRISTAETFEILYFFLYRDYVVFRCRCFNYIKENYIFSTVVVNRDGKVDFYNADLSKAKNKALASKIEVIAGGI